MKTRKISGHFKAALYMHQKWLDGDPTASAADFRGADLSYYDFRGYNLSKANLSRASLEGANLSKVNMTGANLSGANLHTATIKNANLTNAVLARAFLGYVAFEKVNLTGADLTGADLAGVNLSGATFGEDWNSQVNLAKFKIVPEGDIIGWKKLRGGSIAKLLIPKEARRSNGFNRRCRAEYVKVLSIINENDEPVPEGVSRRDAALRYIVGEVCKPDGWDEEWKNECSQGINFFLTYEEADAY